MMNTEDLLIYKRMKDYDIKRFLRLSQEVQMTSDLLQAYHKVMKMIQYTKNMDYDFTPISDNWELDPNEAKDWGAGEREDLQNAIFQLISVLKNDNMNATQAQDEIYFKMLAKNDVNVLDFNKRYIDTGELGRDEHSNHFQFMDLPQQYKTQASRQEAQKELQDDLQEFTLLNHVFPTLSFDQAFQVALKLGKTADYFEGTCIFDIFNILNPNQATPNKDKRYYFSPKGSRVGFDDYSDSGWGPDTGISNIYNYMLGHDVEIHLAEDLTVD